MRTEWEQISGRADVDHTPSEAGITGSYMIALSSADDLDVDTTALTTAYQALLDLFKDNRVVIVESGDVVILEDGVIVVETCEGLALYVDSNTGFSRSVLSEALSAYYAAESAVTSGVTEAKAVEPVEYLRDATNNGALYASGGLALTNVFAVLGASAEEIAAMTDAEKAEAIRAFVSGIDGDGLAFGAHSEDAYTIAKNYIDWYEGGQSGTEPTRPNFVVSDEGKVITNEMVARNATVEGNIAAQTALFYGSYAAPVVNVSQVAEDGVVDSSKYNFLSPAMNADYTIDDSAIVGSVLKIYEYPVLTRVGASGSFVIQGDFYDIEEDVGSPLAATRYSTISFVSGGVAGYAELIKVSDGDALIAQWTLVEKKGTVSIS